MKNIFIIPTDKPSRLVQGKNLYFYKDGIEKKFIDENEKLLNIYITSDEEIEWDSYWLNLDNNVVSNGAMFELADKAPSCKKITLTTDLSLTKDGVQAIDDDFLEWFVKNPSCEEVVVENSSVVKEHIFDGSNDGEVIWEYKIIISKEEPKERLKKILGTKHPKQECKGSFKDCFKPLDECVCDTMEQETLEEVAKRTYQKGLEDDIDLSFYDGVRAGAKWQQERSYSEEEVLEIIRQYAFEEHLITSSKPDVWFQKFKKK